MNFEKQSTFLESKLNNLALPLATIAFTLLFHQSDIGLNLALFNIAMVAFLYMSKPQSFRKWEVKGITLITIVTSFCAVWYGSPDTIIWSIISLGLLSQKTLFPDMSILLLETRIILGSLITPILRLSEVFNIEKEKEAHKEPKKNKTVRVIFVVILPLIFTLIFAAIYRQMNPYFDEFCREIEVYINFEVFVTATIGLYICTVFLKAYLPDELLQFDQKLKNVFTADNAKTNNNVKLEIQSGLALFGMLNLTLCIFLISDIMFLQTLHLQGSLNHSKYVHQGVGVLIFSIVLATAFILFFFRGKEISEMPKSSWLKRLALLWVVLNMSILITTAVKNFLYIDEYALTVKRIGVFIYLLCAIAGLMIAFVKVHQAKTNAFLFRKTYWAFIIILTANLCMDWSTLIVKHNLNAHIEKGQDLDWRYLLRMDNRTLPLVAEKIDQLKIGDQQAFEDYYNDKLIRLQNYNPKVREIVISDLMAKQKLNTNE